MVRAKVFKLHADQGFHHMIDINKKARSKEMKKLAIISFTGLLSSACLLILTKTEQTAAFFNKEPVIIDDKPISSSDELESLIKLLCESKESKDELVSRISTVVKLAEHFEEQLHDDRLTECRLKYSESIKELKEVVTLSSKNVCSEEKVSLIDKFHRKYISTVPAPDNELRIDEQVVANEAPYLLRLFFMHYAMEVSAICKRNLINNLEWELGDEFTEEDYEFGSNRGVLSRIVTNLNNYFSSNEAVNNYEDVILIWDLIQGDMLDESSKELKNAANVCVDKSTGEPVKLILKARYVVNVKMMQQKCSRKFRPVYETLILPIIRLSDLGYSSKGEQFSKEIEEFKKNRLVKIWYNLTQLCEAILPIKFVHDKSLREHQAVIITKEEADFLEQQQPVEAKSQEPVFEYTPTTNSMLRIDKLDSVSTAEARNLVNKVKLNVDSRDRALRRTLLKVIRNLRTSNFSYLFISYKAQIRKILQDDSLTKKVPDGESSKRFVKKDIQDVLIESLADMSEFELLKLEGAMRREPIGKKRRIAGRIAAIVVFSLVIGFFAAHAIG